MSVVVRSLAVTIVAALALATSPPAGGLGAATETDPSRYAGPPDIRGRVLASEPVPDAPPGAVAHRVRYLSTTPKDRPTVVTGLVMRPAGTPPPGGWPVVSWGHGTTGIADKCAPSELEGYASDPLFGVFLDAGYAVAATDYEGLGGPGAHPYLVAESEARSVIDMVRAARHVGSQFSDEWFAVGHSQGGHAAIAAGDAAAGYGDGLALRGTIAFAPAPDASQIAGEVHLLDPFVRGLYVMMLVGLKTQDPGLRFDDFLGRDAIAHLPTAYTECYADVIAAYYDLPTAEFEITDPTTVEKLRRLLADNAVPRAGSGAPLLILQGGMDVVNPVLGAEQIAAKACDLSWQQQLSIYPDAGHLDITEVAAPQAVAWMNARLDGAPAVDQCDA